MLLGLASLIIPILAVVSFEGELNPPSRNHTPRRRRSGLGLEGAGQMFWRRSLIGSTRPAMTASGRGTLYRDEKLDDGSVQFSVGPEFNNRLRTSFFVGRRWYRGRGYSWSHGVNLQWLKPVSRTMALDLRVRTEHVVVERSATLDRTSYTASGALERSLPPTLFTRLSASASHYDARSASFTTTMAGTGFLLAKDFGRISLYGQLNYSRLGAAAGSWVNGAGTLG